MKIIGTNILIQEIEEKITNDVGIIYTKSLDKGVRYKKGVVCGTGSDITFCSDNDYVYFDSAQASEIRIEDKKYIIVDQKAIVAVL